MPVVARHSSMKSRLSSLLLAPLAPMALLVLVDCSQTPVSVPVRSLERSGKVTLICLDPYDSARTGYPLDGCGFRLADRPGGSGLPTRLHALVNQETRGEVAVLNLSDGVVVDTNDASPGFNFLPVGAQPTDIVASPEGTAAFVVSAEANHPGIYALPSNHLRGGGPTIRAWPACSLPARPGAMTLVRRPAGQPQMCGGTNYAIDVVDKERDPDGTKAAEEAKHPNGDLSLETSAPGAQKLLVALPTEGDLIVIDAQRVLDRKPGTFDKCPIERRIKLRVDLPSETLLPEVPSGPVCPPLSTATPSPACPVRPPVSVAYPKTFTPMPAELALANPLDPANVDAPRRLYVADEGAPVVHVLDVRDPCEPVEGAPLLPSSFDEPARPVTTSTLAVSPVTHDLKQFVYAVDYEQGSVMIFDVSDDAKTRSPLVRPRPDFFPYSARDRLALGGPVRALSFITQEVNQQNATGAFTSATMCDPTAPSNSAAGVYQTRADFSDGAGPKRLRGTFALAALTNGALSIVDVDDLDAACRRYGKIAGTAPDATTVLPSWLTGCDTAPPVCGVGPEVQDKLVGTSGETTCRAIVRHELRSARYVLNRSEIGRGQPGFVAFPTLSKKGATFRTDTSDEGLKYPKMLAPLPDTGNDWAFDSGGTVISVTSSPASPTADKNFYVTDVTEPRAHFDQSWTLTYEGILPGFDGKVARISLAASKDDDRGVFDPNAYFCSAGVHDVDATKLEAVRILGANRAAEYDGWAAAHADQVEITADILPEEDPYWSSTGSACDFVRCRATFGTTENPSHTRTFPIRKAYQDRVLVDALPGGGVIDVTDADGKRVIAPECCFPFQAGYRVRAGQTWVANGSASGFLHHVTVDANTGRCIDMGVIPGTTETCDATRALLTGRAYEVPHATWASKGTGIGHADPLTFHNPQMYFAIYEGTEPSTRDMQFAWQAAGGFVPLAISLGRGSSGVAPQSMIHHPVLGPQVLVTDASLQGVMLVDLYQLAVTFNYF